MEFCPNCGNEVASLNENSGWCSTCDPSCNNCGRPVNSGRPLCYSCIRIQWLEEHADAVEEEMAKGHSLSQAIKLVYDSKRPVCLVCNSAIPHANGHTTKFCKKTKECRSARRRYRTLIEGATKLDPPVAVYQVLLELGKI